MRFIYVCLFAVIISSLFVGCSHLSLGGSQNIPIPTTRDDISGLTPMAGPVGKNESSRKGSEEQKEKKINGELVVLGIIFTVAGVGLWANANSDENDGEDRGMYKTFGTIGFCVGIPMTLFGLIPR